MKIIYLFHKFANETDSTKVDYYTKSSIRHHITQQYQYAR